VKKRTEEGMMKELMIDAMASKKVPEALSTLP
jgi:hypothetical protein